MFKILKASMVVVMVGFVSACATAPNTESSAKSHQPASQLSNFMLSPTKVQKKKTLDIKDGIQWNEEYRVVSTHTQRTDETNYNCDTCEITFVKHKATKSVPQWRESVPGEELNVMSLTKDNSVVTTKVKDINLANSTTTNRDSEVYLLEGQFDSDMTGGIIYSNDNKIVGLFSTTTMGVGVSKTVSEKVIKNKHQLAIYVPYSTIQTEWEKFKNSQH